MESVQILLFVFVLMGAGTTLFLILSALLKVCELMRGRTIDQVEGQLASGRSASPGPYSWHDARQRAEAVRPAAEPGIEIPSNVLRMYSYARRTSTSEASECAPAPSEEAAEEEQEDLCAICLEELVVGDAAAGLPCSHSFHETCIRKWLATQRGSHRRMTCPVCKASAAERTTPAPPDADHVRVQVRGMSLVVVHLPPEGGA